MSDSSTTKRARVTAILTRLESDEGASTDNLLPLVYDELKQMAQAKMHYEKPGHTLQATALVHEAYLRLVDDNGEKDGRWESRAHFFGAAAQAMRRILVDSARRKKARKHGGELERVPLDGIEISSGIDDDTLLAVDEALERLAEKDEEAARLVKLRFFVGLTNVEAANVLGLAERTATQTWAYARAWLYKEIRKTL